MASALRTSSCLLAAVLLVLGALHIPALAEGQQPIKVAVDVGHTKLKPGATSARGRSEYYFNQDFVKTLLATLNAREGIEAFPVNAETAEISLEGRVRAAEAKGGDLLLSIHHDSVQQHYLQTWTHGGKAQHYCDRFAGHSLFVSLRNGAPWKSYILAYLIGDYLDLRQFRPSLHHAEKIDGEGRELLNTELGVYRFDNLVVLRKARIPAVLIECGVIVNRQEELTVTSTAFQTAFAGAIADALADYKALYAAAQKEDFALYRAPIELAGTIRTNGSGAALCPLAGVCLPLLWQEAPGLRDAALAAGKSKRPATYQGCLDYYGAGTYFLLPEHQRPQ